MKHRKPFFSVMLVLATLFVAGVSVQAQEAEQKISVTIRPAQTVEERVAEEVKAKELRKAADERLASEESARIAVSNPKALLKRARTIYITSGTSFFEPQQLQNALHKRREFDEFNLVLVGGWDQMKIADLLIQVDRPLFTYRFTYQITDRATGIILATGKVIAFDGDAAAPKLALRIVDDIKKARGTAKKDQ